MYSANLYIHIAFGVGLTILAYFITLGMKNVVQIMDRTTERSSHHIASPRAGGVSIVIAWAIGMAALQLTGAYQGIDTTYLLGFVVSTLIISAISLLDDVLEQSVRVKFLTHTIAVFIVLYFGVYVDRLALPGLGLVSLGWVGYLFSFCWIVGLTNAYNFIDGLDGLAGGIAVIASLFFMVITFSQGSSFVYITSYTILAGTLGFMFLNFPPAKIILGDVGAAFLGFVFATLAIIAARYDDSHTSFLVMPLLLFNVIYDTGFTFMRRLINGERVTQAHRTHLYQLLNRSGYSHLEVVLIQYCMVFLQGLGALIMVQIPGEERILVFVPFLVLQMVYSYLVIQRFRRNSAG